MSPRGNGEKSSVKHVYSEGWTRAWWADKDIAPEDPACITRSPTLALGHRYCYDSSSVVIYTNCPKP